MPTRRRFLKHAALGSAWFMTPGLLAAELALTPRQTEGPFYPDKLPLDTDNDLLIITDSITPAVGEITHLTGRVLDPSGEPMRNTLVEIWQCDNNGAYLHTGTTNAERRDRNFQGYGRFFTDTEGRYYFRTIKPVPYPGRTPHIHFALSQDGQRMLTTQLYISGHEGNERDGIFRSMNTPERKAAVSAEFTAIEDSEIGELAAHWEIVIGQTPEEPDPRGGGPGM
jgi:protocatechuate 3,4-dioxygenase beta subunit